MDKLPPEVLTYVAKNLTKKDQLQWALTNRWWCEWLRSGYLFTEVHLCIPYKKSNPQNTNCNIILDFLERGKYGNTTRHITISGREHLQLEILSKITETLPNIEWLTWDINTNILSEELERTICKWKRIKKIDGTYAEDIAKTVISMSPIAGQLESLILRYCDKSICHLKNTPKLKSLTIKNAYDITSDILFDIYDILGHLESLNLSNLKSSSGVRFYPENSNHEVKKVESLNHFTITDGDSFTTEFWEESLLDIAGLMKHISNIFTSLVSFEFAVAPRASTQSYREEIRNSLCVSLSKWKKLKKYNFSLCQLDETILQIMKDNGIKLQHLTIYLLQHLCQQLNPFALLLRYSEIVENLTVLCIRQSVPFGRVPGVGTGQSLVELLDTIPNLNTLKLQHCQDVLGFNPDLVMAILVTLPKLRCLEVDLYPSSMPEIYLSPNQWNEKQLSQLVSLYVGATANRYMTRNLEVFNTFIENIALQCPLLQQFETGIYFTRDSELLSDAKTVDAIFPFHHLIHMQEMDIYILFEPCGSVAYNQKMKEERYLDMTVHVYPDVDSMIQGCCRVHLQAKESAAVTIHH